MSTERTQAIEHAASAWLIRRDSGAWTPLDETRFQEWLEASSLHRVAYLRLELAWEDAARLKALGAGVGRDRPPPRGDWNLTPFFDSPGRPAPVDAKDTLEVETDANPVAGRGSDAVASIGRELAAAGVSPVHALPQRVPGVWKIRALSTAAAVALALMGAAYVWLTPSGDRYATPIGGLASVPLRDGSSITLNTATEVRVALTGTERDIELARGEVFFEVAKDAERPFVVNAGKKRVIAVGTQFSVLRDGDDIRVIVSEGTVRIEDLSAASLPPELPLTEASAANSVLISAGSVAHAGGAGVLVNKETLSETQEHLSWRTGVLMFRDQTLAEAAAEFNRYNERKIVIRDAAVAQLKIEGNFRATNVDAFIRLLESGLPVRASTNEHEIVLTSN